MHAPATRPVTCRRTITPVCRIASAAALSDNERGVLHQYKKGPGNDKESVLAVLSQAAATKSVPPETVEGALLLLEEISNAEPSRPTPSVEGRWRLVFGTGTKIRSFQYIPVKEDFVLQLASKEMALESSVGPFGFYIRGAVAGWRAEGGQLDFQFNKVDIHFLGNKVWEVSPKTKPKTYTFFHVGPALAGARSSGGGVALLVKGQEQ